MFACPYNRVTVTIKDGTQHSADACIITVPLGAMLKANRIKFELELPTWKSSVITNLGAGKVNRILSGP
jgi:monoamine oxidase